MAQTGYTPIQLYYSSTTTNAPLAANLANGELAINITDGKLFYKDNANAVQVIGWKVVPATAGGTGQTSYAVGDLLYADTTTTLAKLPDVATGNALISGGVGVAPSWGKIGLTTHVSGVLPVANGGTALSSFTANGIAYASSTSALATGSALTFNGTNFATTGTISGTNHIVTGGSASGNSMYLATTNTIAWSINGSEQLRLNSSGNLLVGTTTNYDSAKIVAVGSNAISVVVTGVGGGALNTDYTAGSGTSYFGYFRYGGSVVGQITSTGVGTLYSSISDYRLKENIAPMLGALDKVAQLKPVTYKWKSNGEESQGFIAHELQEIFPEAVSGEKDAVNENGSIKPQAIDTSVLIATLTAAIQEQQTMIQNLQSKLKAAGIQGFN